MSKKDLPEEEIIVGTPVKRTHLNLMDIVLQVVYRFDQYFQF